MKYRLGSVMPPSHPLLTHLRAIQARVEAVAGSVRSLREQVSGIVLRSAWRLCSVQTAFRKSIVPISSDEPQGEDGGDVGREAGGDGHDASVSLRTNRQLERRLTRTHEVAVWHDRKGGGDSRKSGCDRNRCACPLRSYNKTALLLPQLSPK
jgi:hypothetical protein